MPSYWFLPLRTFATPGNLARWIAVLAFALGAALLIAPKADPLHNLGWQVGVLLIFLLVDSTISLFQVVWTTRRRGEISWLGFWAGASLALGTLSVLVSLVLEAIGGGQSATLIFFTLLLGGGLLLLDVAALSYVYRKDLAIRTLKLDRHASNFDLVRWILLGLLTTLISLGGFLFLHGDTHRSLMAYLVLYLFSQEFGIGAARILFRARTEGMPRESKIFLTHLLVIFPFALGNPLAGNEFFIAHGLLLLCAFVLGVYLWRYIPNTPEVEESGKRDSGDQP